MAFLDLIQGSPRTSRAGGLFSFAQKAAQVRRQRLALQRLTDAELSDIGLTRADVVQEANRSFWDVPHTWRA